MSVVPEIFLATVMGTFGGIMIGIILFMLIKPKKMTKKIKIPKIPKNVLEEIKHFRKTNIPRCVTCKQNFVEVKPHCWKPVCKHHKGVGLMIG